MSQRLVVCEACYKLEDLYYWHRDSLLCSSCRDKDLSWTPLLYYGMF